MKQLLDCGGGYLIVGCSDRVFAGRLESPQICELERSPAAPPPVSASERTGAILDAQQEGEIQAVGVYRRNDGQVWCAVARYDKSLCLYRIESASADVDESNTKIYVNPPASKLCRPCATYKTAKRVTSLCFATVKDVGDSSKDLTVIIAAGLAGDAVAFALLEQNVGTHDQAVEATTDPDEDVSANNTASRRLLLGHTATMLTSVCVGQDVSQRQHIFTADRDEKTRISSFPDTHILEGFLLGHEAFVSGVDVAREGEKPRCVSCSGDGSVRMWDYISNEELGQYTMPAPGEGVDLPLLTQVAMNPQGTVTVVCVDDQAAAFLLRWKEGERRFELIVGIDIGPALAAMWIDNETFVTLTTTPDHVRMHRLVKEGSGSAATVLDVELPLIKALNLLAIKAGITFPTSILERDEHGVLKMQKQEEKRIQNTDRAWNDAARIDTAKARDRRYKKRKAERDATATTDELDDKAYEETS